MKPPLLHSGKESYPTQKEELHSRTLMLAVMDTSGEQTPATTSTGEQESLTPTRKVPVGKPPRLTTEKPPTLEKHY